ncbi:hypothetical protein SAMN05421823_11914 [Catalinimonas alkaloidigena]|uniref:Uncharacterized protein n=1 Tax=Catalinimonas alkaloidigena TaxID=1075417 RepID=A0A1G9V4P1_9BACT|nr:hypothetical protein [Catalinimonas alkaloidigena]SDM67080.1 hypothetical protein SAMN05421823_11914 [Catalinimonas alkaloidigena]
MSKKKFIMFRGHEVSPEWPEVVREAQRDSHIYRNGVLMERVTFGREPGSTAPQGPCWDCHAIEGEYHVPGCRYEVCPNCGQQLVSCPCAPDAPPTGGIQRAKLLIESVGRQTKVYSVLLNGKRIYQSSPTKKDYLALIGKGNRVLLRFQRQDVIGGKQSAPYLHDPTCWLATI